MWITKGQWLHMNIITVPFSPFAAFNDMDVPETVSRSSKFGALVPKGSMLLGVLAIFIDFLFW